MENKKLIIISTIIAFTILGAFAVYVDKKSAVKYEIESSKEKVDQYTIKIDSMEKVIDSYEHTINILVIEAYSEDVKYKDSLMNLSAAEIEKLLRQ